MATTSKTETDDKKKKEFIPPPPSFPPMMSGPPPNPMYGGMPPPNFGSMYGGMPPMMSGPPPNPIYGGMPPNFVSMPHTYGSMSNISLNRHEITATIKQRYATIVYSFDFENVNESKSEELKFEITIDANAFISGFMADIDGEIFIGQTKEKQEAKQEYIAAKQKDENAILITQPNSDIPNVFQIQTNIDSKSKILLTITIEQYLTKKLNDIQLNVEILKEFHKYNINPKCDSIAYTIDISDQFAIYDVNIQQINDIQQLNDNIVNITGKIMNQSPTNELVLKYKLKGEQNESHILFDKKTKTFCHVISDLITNSVINETNNTDEGKNDNIVMNENVMVPRRVVIIIDRSGSMGGIKWTKTISATITALKQLRYDIDRYCVILCGNQLVFQPNQTMILVDNFNVNKCIKYLETQHATGCELINDALLKGIDMIKNDIKLLNENENENIYNYYQNQVILLTDGEPTIGETNTDKIILNVKNANDLRNIDKYSSKVSVHTFGIGRDGNDGWCSDLNHSFLKCLALNNKGIYQRIKQTQTDTLLNEYFNILSKPVLTNINIKYQDTYCTNLTKTTFDTLFAGNDIVICGELQNTKILNITIDISAITAKQIKQNDETFYIKPIEIKKTIKVNLNEMDEKSDDNENYNENIYRIWAYLKLKQFSEQRLMNDDMIEYDEYDDKIPLSLAMKNHFISPWTSMIVVKKKIKKEMIQNKLKQKQYSMPLFPPQPSLQHTIPSISLTDVAINNAPEFIPTPSTNVSKMNELIGDVVGNYHSLGVEQKFQVDQVYGTFIKMKKTKPAPTSTSYNYTNYKRTAAKRGSLMISSINPMGMPPSYSMGMPPPNPMGMPPLAGPNPFEPPPNPISMSSNQSNQKLFALKESESKRHMIQKSMVSRQDYSNKREISSRRFNANASMIDFNTNSIKPTKQKSTRLKFDKSFKPQKHKSDIFIWGKARPSTLIPQNKSLHYPCIHNTISQKRFIFITAAKDGSHCFGITDNDWSFVWGESNFTGSLGLGNKVRSTLPYLLKSLRKQNIIHISCSSRHGIAVTNASIVYGWGSKLLTNLNNDCYQPQRLAFLDNLNILSVDCCQTHSAVYNWLNTDIYTFGLKGPWLGLLDENKTFGKVMFEEKDNITNNEKMFVSKVCVSNQYTMYLLSNGVVYANGINEHGRMGCSKKISELYRPMKVLINESIGEISLGQFHAGFISLKGKLFTCGVGVDYRLGHGTEETKFVPTLVQSLKDVKCVRVECVQDRTFVITKYGAVIMFGVEPVTKQIYKVPHILENLRSHRIYQICGTKECTVALGVKSKEPVIRPNCDNV